MEDPIQPALAKTSLRQNLSFEDTTLPRGSFSASALMKVLNRSKDVTWVLGFTLNWAETARQEMEAQPFPQSFGPDGLWHKLEKFSGYSQFSVAFNGLQRAIMFGRLDTMRCSIVLEDSSSGQAELLLP
ncbi:hypothetical protein BTVI_143083 [Pitangus sulphuratus]|nr:hypothetical protein BTVI_143083 [Pitangus sulphuratus]